MPPDFRQRADTSGPTSALPRAARWDLTRPDPQAGYSASRGAAYRFMDHEGDVFIAEARLLPSNATWPEGQWSDDPASAPLGGLTARERNLLRLGQARKLWQERRRQPVTRRIPPAEVAQLAAEAAEHPRRAGRSDLFYARIARLYINELDARTAKPINAVADILGRPPTYVRDALRTARQRDLLTTARRSGRGTADLTSPARTLLGEAGQRPDEPATY
jgi:hypothetical protein